MSKNHNPIGFHYYPDDQHYRQEDLDRWLPILSEHGARWLTLQGPKDRPVPETFVRGLLEAGVQPIVHIPCQLGSMRSEDINPVLYSYAHWGVKHVVVYDRPNLQTSWTHGQWSRSGLVERFLDAALPVLQAALSAGLRPTLPPLEPGGDYWDTAFLESALRGIARRGQRDLLRSLTIGAYAWTFGRPLDWGAGGPEAWPGARPYSTPEGSQDQRGLRVFDWYKAIAREVAGEPLSTVVLAGGATDASGRSPAKDAGAQAHAIGSALSSLDDERALEAFCFYLLGADPSHDESAFAWYGPSGQPLRIAQEYRQAQQAGARPKSGAPDAEKLFDHYLLLPAEESNAVPAWRRASAFAVTHRPVVGFSAKEASHAEKVTIAGGHDLVPAETERALEAAGCRVQRLTLLPTRKSTCRPGESEDPISPGSD